MGRPSRPPGSIVQFGSGHPGEEGSAAFEAALFEELGLENPNILFFPFHRMPPNSGDLALFRQIYGGQTKGWIRSVQLEPPRWPIHTAEIFSWLDEADLVVLGSGFPEPFSRLMFRLGMPQKLRQMHQKGVHFLGYSAGSLTISEGYYLPFTGEDLLIQLGLLDHISMDDEKRQEMEDSMMSCLEREDAREFVEGVRAKLEAHQELKDEELAFYESPLWMESAKGFGLTPGLTANPHYGEQFQYRKIHLRHLAELYPDLVHVGIPNRCALVSRYQEDGTRTVTFRGFNPRREAHFTHPEEGLQPIQDGFVLPEEIFS